jgi:photosystem II stability/assembly factor-like uncharacterized protein
MYPYEDHYFMKYGDDGMSAIKAYDRAMDDASLMMSQSGSRLAGTWNIEGPGNLGARINTIAVNPNNPNNILLGYSEGGIYRTTNGGTTWTPVFDDKRRTSIGSIVFDPTNPNIVYVGTGDPNVSGFPFIGEGVYKSIDNGVTWNKVGLESTRIISNMYVSPQNPQTIYASAMGIPFLKTADRGFYKSTDGGSSWNKSLFINDSTGVSDFVVHPQNDQIIYALGWNRIRSHRKGIVSGPDAKVYKSTNGGTTWEILTGGLPQGNYSRLGIDISKSNPNILYVTYVDASTLNITEIYKTNNAGLTWDALPTNDLPGVTGGFGWYFGKIKINPVDPDDIFILGVSLIRSRDGGTTWDDADDFNVHADKHDLQFAGGSLFLATDGGAYKSTDNSDSWRDIENIPTTQFYRVGYNPHRPDLYYGGAQDNGTSGGNRSTINNWDRLFGADGFQPLFDAQDPNIVYAETQNGGLWVSDDGGNNWGQLNEGIMMESVNWDAPFVMDENDSKIMITGTTKVYKRTTGEIGSWTAISSTLTNPQANYLRKNISALAISPFDHKKMMVGTSEARIWVTKDDGANWIRCLSPILPDRYVSSVAFSKHWPDRIYATYSGYKDNDDSPHILMSNDFGVTWQTIAKNLPNFAINKLLVLPSKADILDDVLAIATDAGVYFRQYPSSSNSAWDRVGDNMPLVAVYDVGYNPVRNELVAGTFAKSIQSFDLDQIGYTVGVKDVKSSLDAKIQPSVSSNYTTIKLGDGIDKAMCTVYNAYGNVVLHTKVRNDDEIQTAAWKSGVYYIIIKKGSVSKTLKYLKI